MANFYKLKNTALLLMISKDLCILQIKKLNNGMSLNNFDSIQDDGSKLGINFKIEISLKYVLKLIF